MPISFLSENFSFLFTKFPFRYTTIPRQYNNFYDSDPSLQERVTPLDTIRDTKRIERVAITRRQKPLSSRLVPKEPRSSFLIFSSGKKLRPGRRGDKWRNRKHEETEVVGGRSRRREKRRTIATYE